jgi:hypothetical protein
MTDKAAEHCDAIWSRSLFDKTVDTKGLMVRAYRMGRAIGYEDGRTDGLNLATALLPQPTVRGKPFEPTDAELEASEQRAARCFADCGDTPEPLPTWTTVPDGSPMVP